MLSSTDVLFSSGGDGWAGLGKLMIWSIMFFISLIGVLIISLGWHAIKTADEDEKYYTNYDDYEEIYDDAENIFKENSENK